MACTPCKAPVDRVKHASCAGIVHAPRRTDGDRPSSLLQAVLTCTADGGSRFPRARPRSSSQAALTCPDDGWMVGIPRPGSQTRSAHGEQALTCDVIV